MDPTLNLKTHFNKTYKKAAGRLNLLKQIHSTIDTFSMERVYRTMIMPIFTYYGQNTLGWSHTCKSQTRSFEEQRHRFSVPNSSCVLCLLTVENFLNNKVCLFVFYCCRECLWSLYALFFFLSHHTVNTRSNGTIIYCFKSSKTKTRVSFLEASVFNSLPLRIPCTFREKIFGF